MKSNMRRGNNEILEKIKNKKYDLNILQKNHII